MTREGGREESLRGGGGEREKEEESNGMGSWLHTCIYLQCIQ